MKKLRFGLMLLLVVLVSGSTMAMGILNVNIIPGKSERALVNISNAENNKYEIVVSDSNGDVVYVTRKKSPSENFSKIYDFSNLEDGRYTFSVKLGNETKLNKIIVKDGKAEIVGQEEQIAPYFKMDGKLLEFSFLNFTQKGMKLYVYDNDNDLIYKENLNPVFALHQAIDLSKLDPGTYNAVLESSAIHTAIQLDLIDNKRQNSQ